MAQSLKGRPTWTEVRVAVPLGWSELVADQLTQGPCTTVVFGRTQVGMDAPPEGCDWVRAYLMDERDTASNREQLDQSLANLATLTGAEELEGLTATYKPVPPEDWSTSWKKSWKAFRVGNIAVVPPWRKESLRPTDVRLELVPGGVFGSGRHATTRACLRALQSEGVEGARVLDAGSGSGILSVAAARLGAREVFGFDVDPGGERYASALAQDNGVQEQCSFATGGFEVLAARPGQFDVVLANIYSDIIQKHVGDLAARLKPQGWFAFSGCPLHHLDATRDAIQGAGLDFRLDVRGRWVTFIGRVAR